MKTISPIIQPEELIKLNQNAYLLFDASAGSKARYDEQHLEGSFYIDLNTDLAHIQDYAFGGRHPLPGFDLFSKVLAKYGVTKDSHVIIYDDKNGSNAAARFWWMLKSIGHESVQVLNGGFDAAVKAGFPLSSETPFANQAEVYKIIEWQLPTADINEVEKAAKSENHLVIDVRDANRFAGLTEPIDLIAGHIPGAINIPFTENLDENGAFLAPEILKAKYLEAFANMTSDHVIVHCGSGVTACHTLLALDYAGLKIPKLYVGSWSEWSRNNKEMILKS